MALLSIQGHLHCLSCTVFTELCLSLCNDDCICNVFNQLSIAVVSHREARGNLLSDCLKKCTNLVSVSQCCVEKLSVVADASTTQYSSWLQYTLMLLDQCIPSVHKTKNESPNLNPLYACITTVLDLTGSTEPLHQTGSGNATHDLHWCNPEVHPHVVLDILCT